MNLKTHPDVVKLAKDLGCVSSNNPLDGIIQWCKDKVRKLVSEFSVSDLDSLLDVVAAYVDTKFIEVHSNSELREVRDFYFRNGENGFVRLQQELTPNALAITFRRLRPGKGEPAFISVIDCRGDKVFRSYFSKWHEIAHLLTLTDPYRLKFCRTHLAVDYESAEELLMEEIAAELAFFSGLICRHAEGPITFEKIRRLRDQLCRKASWESAVNNFCKQWPTPCVLVDIIEANGNGITQRNGKSGLFEVVRFTSSKTLHPLNRLSLYGARVPKTSVIQEAFTASSREEIIASENLSSWNDESGRPLPAMQVRIEARKERHHLRAILVPAEIKQEIQL